MIVAVIGAGMIVGGSLAGGIFTIVLVPLAVIALVSAILYAMWGRATQGTAGGSTEATSTAARPLPHEHQPGGPTAPSSPEALADARRSQQ